jgi:protocatechuate 3,4-dioxygenase beta subunit
MPQYELPTSGDHPPLASSAYLSSRLRAPLHAPVALPQRLTEITGPLLGEDRVSASDADLTRQHDGAPLGQRAIVAGRVLDGTGRAVPHTLVEIWQANAAGRYRHDSDRWDAPLDPNFTGLGRTMTDADGRYRFVTVVPGAYPWRNHHNAWRPAHIHLSLFGRSFTQRLVTQMYFPGDPLLDLDPIFRSVPAGARSRLVSRFSIEATVPQWALAYEFDIVLRGPRQTPFDDEEHEH